MNMVTHDLVALLALRRKLVASLAPPFHAYKVRPPRGRSFYALGRSAADAMRLIDRSSYRIEIGLQESVELTRMSR